MRDRVVNEFDRYDPNRAAPPDPAAVAEGRKLALEQLQPSPAAKLKELFELGETDPHALAILLEEQDPFGVYKRPPKRGSAEVPKGVANTGLLFACPAAEERVSLPDLRNREATEAFRDRGEGERN